MSTPAERIDALVRLLDTAGVARVDPPMLLDANQYFDLAGEEFGRSMLVTMAEDGNEYCLRPEFTIPIVGQYVHQGLIDTPAAYGYLGPVFRQQNGDGPTEYTQAGVELLGHLDPERAFDDVLAFARRVLNLYDVSMPVIRLGGVGLFEAVLDAAEMPAVWRPRIRARFGHPDAMSRLLDRLAEGRNGGGVPAEADDPGDHVRLVDQVTEQMLAAGFNPGEGRRPEEIAARYREKRALAAAHVPAATIELLRRYLAIVGPAPAALDAAANVAAAAGINVDAALTVLRRHVAALRALAPGAPIGFEASFSPRLEYYTGVVFEMRGAGGDVLASGGQYDRLLQRLGAARPVAASGCAIWVDRLEEEFSR